MFNKSEIMKRAWVVVRGADTDKYGYRLVLWNALRTAWREAKAESERQRRAQMPPMSPAQRMLWSLECKNRWTQADYAEADRLRAVIREAA